MLKIVTFAHPEGVFVTKMPEIVTMRGKKV